MIADKSAECRLVSPGPARTVDRRGRNARHPQDGLLRRGAPTGTSVRRRLVRSVGLATRQAGDMPNEATVRSRSNILMGVCIGVFPLILASAPVGSGFGRGLWVLSWLSVLVLAIVRAARMGVSASTSGLTVRNFGRDYLLPWSDVASIEAGRSDNVTGFVTTIVIRRLDGSTLIGRGASAYSRGAVERWRDELLAVREGQG